jgi:small nuclear ribonucleoprotein (snRNP)-like protein
MRFTICSSFKKTLHELVLILGNYRVNEEVVIRLKWGQTEYKGRLVSIDSYMNIQLSGAEEWIDQQMTSVLGQVLIRYVDRLENNRGWVE